jgi:hypothetical protein
VEAAESNYRGEDYSYCVEPAPCLRGADTASANLLMRRFTSASPVCESRPALRKPQSSRRGPQTTTVSRWNAPLKSRMAKPPIAKRYPQLFLPCCGCITGIKLRVPASENQGPNEETCDEESPVRETHYGNSSRIGQCFLRIRPGCPADKAWGRSSRREKSDSASVSSVAGCLCSLHCPRIAVRILRARTRASR